MEDLRIDPPISRQIVPNKRSKSGKFNAQTFHVKGQAASLTGDLRPSGHFMFELIWNGLRRQNIIKINATGTRLHLW